MSFDTKKNREMQSYDQNAKPSAPPAGGFSEARNRTFAALVSSIYNRRHKGGVSNEKAET